VCLVFFVGKKGRASSPPSVVRGLVVSQPRHPSSVIRHPWSVVPWSVVGGPLADFRFQLFSLLVMPPSSVIRPPSSVIRSPWSVVSGLAAPSSVIRHPSSVVSGRVVSGLVVLRSAFALNPQLPNHQPPSMSDQGLKAEGPLVTGPKRPKLWADPFSWDDEAAGYDCLADIDNISQHATLAAWQSR
jgi:hypothetical protein